MKPAIDDDSLGVAETEAMSAEVNDAIGQRDSARLSRYFERELDEIHTSRSSSARSDSVAHTSDRDREEREEREVAAALARLAGESLAGQGIRVARVVPDGEGTGYVFTARDRAGRSFEARLRFEDALATAGPHDGFVRRSADVVVQRVLAARDHYFRRMTS